MSHRHPLAFTVGLLAIATASISSTFLPQDRTPGDAQAIRDVLATHYVDGMYVKRDPDLLRAGLATNFVMQVYWQGQLSTRTGAQWLDKMKLDKVPTKKKIDAEIRVLDITGVAAVARVDIHEDARHKYTDYFGLYKTKAGWRLTSKMFHAY